MRQARAACRWAGAEASDIAAIAFGYGASMRSRRGFTLLEMLLVIALMGLVTVGVVIAARPGHATGAARGVRALLLWARIEALLGGHAMAFRYDPGSGSFTVSSGRDCGVGSVQRRLRLAEFPGVRLTGALRDGLVWLPSGDGRSCGGAGVFNGAIVLADARRTVRVVVARTGRVRVERVP